MKSKKISFLCTLVAVSFGVMAEENPFTANQIWMLETINGTKAGEMTFLPFSSRSTGVVYVFPAGWKEGDVFYEASHSLPEGGLLSIFGDQFPAVTFLYSFLDKDHFVLYYPFSVLNTLFLREVIYRGEVTTDE